MVDPVFVAAVTVVLLGIGLPTFAYFFPLRSVLRSLRTFERASGTPVPYAVAAILVAVAVFCAVVVETSGITAAGGVVAAAGVFGPLFAALGLGNRTAFRRVDAATQQPTGSPGQGLVAVTGAASAIDDTFETPDGEALYCSYALQKGRKTHRSTIWQTISEDERVAPVAIDDGSGAVRVDTANATVRAASHDAAMANRRTVDLDAGEPVPDDVAAFLATVGVDSPDRVEVDHRLRYRLVTPGDVVTAVGEYERVITEHDAFWGITAGEGPAYLFTGSYEDTHAGLRKITRWLAPVGVGCTLVGVVGAAWLLV